ncbi:histidine acid phosphatase [Pseudomassariella vexata]|uniref:Histidine acid phosphatase n=1 Tax=Pseudomassariella vexata TaxID=1141098 RepID=A0A1Y2DGW2_9PEZI|nr:histidine acid phosphatase [Pseudomassariella vexata]ORY58499.1 histidine acid phosphatase [Pseudomassariella vexata]
MFPPTSLKSIPILLGFLTTSSSSSAGQAAAVEVDLRWHAPSQTQFNDLATALNGTGIYGFIFNSSTTPDAEYGTYNWCNMPHVRHTEYPVPNSSFSLSYVEVIHRHHKRTPYAANSFPVESYAWNCDDQGLFYFGQHLPLITGEGKGNGARGAETYWSGFMSPVNPFQAKGWTGTCQFPQISASGLDDSWTHGADLYGTYHDLLEFLPSREEAAQDPESWRNKVVYRVTNNQITSQVAGMVIAGMWNTTDAVAVIIQPAGIDSLEPQYSCAVGSTTWDDIKSASNPAWAEHQTAAEDLYASLDDISGIPVDDTETGFHDSFDHYYDNLSARQCHSKPLPCKLINGANSSTTCITQDMANAVYRMGQWEYSQLYRDANSSLAASVGNYGVWIAELAAHFRAVVAGEKNGERGPIYVHNVAHDGSVSRVLSILQVEIMVWPGMGSEVVFEVWKKAENVDAATKRSGYYVRVLFGGQPLKSSNPTLGLIDMLPVETLLAYFDGLVGQNASSMVGKCNGTIPL